MSASAITLVAMMGIIVKCPTSLLDSFPRRAEILGDVVTLSSSPVLGVTLENRSDRGESFLEVEILALSILLIKYISRRDAALLIRASIALFVGDGLGDATRFFEVELNLESSLSLLADATASLF